MNVIGSWSRHFLGEAVKGILFAYKTIHPKYIIHTPHYGT